MNYEIALQTSGPYDRLVDHARWAEDMGLAVLAVPDHYLMALGEAAAEVPAFDALTQLGALARDTTTLHLAVLVSPITFRHPAVLAKTALTIDHLTGGRFSLGIGTGWMEREHEVFGVPLPDRADRFVLLEEALAYVRAMFAGDNPGFAGETFRLEPVPTTPRPVGRIPLIVGGTGSVKTPRLAGTYADEYNCYPAPIEEFRIRVERARMAAAEAGRDPDTILISSAGAVMAAPSRAEYDELRRQSAAIAGLSVDELDAHMDQRNTPRGTYEEVAAELDAYADAGMRRFYLQRPAEFDHEAAAALVAALAG